ncbi:NusG domain II-containing protein [Desulfitobacterium sp.]|uniref:NusG domain II-containing protein n=1 Tax=Desulfitobacterium sp. TaxID=49981 RepID=UPI002B1FA288|nr:NusG domain II-containing protein [Desulfitobacterium sp.]MEA4901420.1 NusG domain II-containing protein [Desulfitobacterium sp.]
MKKIEKVIIGIILLLSIASLGIMTVSRSNSHNSTIVIQVNNKVVREIPLNYSSEIKTYDFNFNGNTAYIESKDGRVRLLEMSKDLCPNSICSNTGWISQTYQSIVCMPNQIIITIKGSEKEKDNEKEDGIDIVI